MRSMDSYQVCNKELTKAMVHSWKFGIMLDCRQLVEGHQLLPVVKCASCNRIPLTKKVKECSSCHQCICDWCYIAQVQLKTKSFMEIDIFMEDDEENLQSFMEDWEEPECPICSKILLRKHINETDAKRAREALRFYFNSNEVVLTWNIEYSSGENHH